MSFQITSLLWSELNYFYAQIFKCNSNKLNTLVLRTHLWYQKGHFYLCVHAAAPHPPHLYQGGAVTWSRPASFCQRVWSACERTPFTLIFYFYYFYPSKHERSSLLLGRYWSTVYAAGPTLKQWLVFAGTCASSCKNIIKNWKFSIAPKCESLPPFLSQSNSTLLNEIPECPYFDRPPVFFLNNYCTLVMRCMKMRPKQQYIRWQRVFCNVWCCNVLMFNSYWPAKAKCYTNVGLMMAHVCDTGTALKQK